MREKNRHWDFSFETTEEAKDFLSTYGEMISDATHPIETSGFELPGTFLLVGNLHLLRSAISILSRDERIASESDLLDASTYLFQLSLGLDRYKEADKTNGPTEVEKIWRRKLRTNLRKTIEVTTRVLNTASGTSPSPALQLG
jgi:hypothetical protein